MASFEGGGAYLKRQAGLEQSKYAKAASLAWLKADLSSPVYRFAKLHWYVPSTMRTLEVRALP